MLFSKMGKESSVSRMLILFEKVFSKYLKSQKLYHGTSISSLGYCELVPHYTHLYHRALYYGGSNGNI